MAIFDMKPVAAVGQIMESSAASVSVPKEIGRRRSWSTEEKLAIVAEVELPGETVTTVARRHEMSPDHLLNWVERAKHGTLERRARRADKASNEVADGGFIDLGTFGRAEVEAMLGGGSAMIEIEFPGPMRVKLPLSMPPGQLTMTVRALKAA
jgi:transposase